MSSYAGINRGQVIPLFVCILNAGRINSRVLSLRKQSRSHPVHPASPVCCPLTIAVYLLMILFISHLLLVMLKATSQGL